MRIVHISTSDKGGAGIAAIRLHRGLMKQGYDSHFLSKIKFGNDKNHQALINDSVFSKVQRRLKSVLQNGNDSSEVFTNRHLKGRDQSFEAFNFPYSEFRIDKHSLVRSADIIHLHWTSDFFLDWPTFFTNIHQPIVWTMHDMNAFTGGCHHSDDCRNYETDCHHCPQLRGTVDDEISFAIQNEKIKELSNIPDSKAVIVSPSKWLNEKARASKIMKRFVHDRIGNGIDTGVFKLQSKAEARAKLNLPSDKKIILFVANDVNNKRKGIEDLREALEKLQNENIFLCTIGKQSMQLLENIPQKNFGFITEDKTAALIYAACDLFVLPSHAENFPNTVCEALCSGKPVVAYNMGGLPELLNDENGMLIPLKDRVALSEAIKTALHRNWNHKMISTTASQALGTEKMVDAYIKTYKSLFDATH